jgi:pimeloyl-ACP methyl ester carboxylesterase
MNHGTELLKRQAPSRWGSGPKSDYPEVLVAHALAIWYGWIVIMPDYQGMGSDVDENHPYCVKDRLANATADMVIAAQQTLSCNRNAYVKWNGKTFLYGFSEGGYVTMVAARELEARNISLNGVVCMDGPYDLSGTMLSVMLGSNPFPVPYFLPMLLVGYNTMYQGTFPFGAMLQDPYRTDLPKYTNGFYDETVVNSKMPPDKILKEVFTNAFYDSLQSPTSKAFKTLYQNNAYVDWTPKSKMLLWHCLNDDCVPYGNLVTAMQSFSQLPNVQPVTWPAVKPSGSSTVHVTVAPRAFYEGSRWIYNLAK